MSLSRGISLHKLPASAQWSLLLVCAGALGQALHRLDIPAALFLGPMLVAIVFGVGGASIRIPAPLFRFGQGCVGMMVAHSLTASVLVSLAQDWHLMLFATLLTVSLSALVGLGLVRFGGMPGSTAAWGTAPGAASAMVAMAEDYGADGRVVATMQYVRVVCVVLVGALVSRLLGVEGHAGAAHGASMPLDGGGLLHLGLVLLAILAGLFAGARVPAGALLVPILFGGALQLSGLLQVGLPTWLLALAYGAIGCYVGLRFDRPTVIYVWRRLPAMIAGAVVLIALCAASAWLLAWLLGTDYLSMYLATSPGGLDSMAIIAVDTHADVGLVLAMQTLRLFGVIVSGAFFARQIIRLTAQRAS